MKNNFLINHDDYAFRIYCNHVAEMSNCLTLRGDGNYLNICHDMITGNIVYIEGTVIENILNENFNLPDFRDIKNLELTTGAFSFYLKNEISSFMLNLDNNELNIILKNNINPKHYFVDGRVEYYYDSKFNLIYVKVVNLTEEEKKYFNCFISSNNMVK